MSNPGCSACEVARKELPEAEYLYCKDNVKLASKLMVMSVPTIAIVDGDMPVQKWVGYSNRIRNEVQQKLRRLG